MMAKSTSYTEMHRKIRIEKRRRRISFVLQLLFVILLSALTAAAFFSSVLIQENSMNPTLRAGDRAFVNRLSYVIGGVRRGDLIAYKGKGEFDSGIHVKRVIGLPGETVQIKDGLILIDGKTYIENRDFPNISRAGVAESGVRLASGEYFVLGDNRNNSEDSRYQDVGNISRASIVGKIWFIGTPFSRTGFVS